MNTTRDETLQQAPPRPRFLRRWSPGRIIVVGLLLLIVGWLVSMSRLFRAVPLHVSPETTVLEGPLRPDGTVDYVAAINAQLSEGVTPENNALVPLMRAIADTNVGARFYALLGVDPPEGDGPFITRADNWFSAGHSLTDEGFGELQAAFDQQLDQALSRPWTVDEFPDVSAWIDDNAVPLEHVAEAAERTRYYHPYVSTGRPAAMFSVQLPVVQRLRGIARVLTSRAMRRLGDGDADAAWEDLRTGHRLARLAGQGGTLIEQLVAIAMESLAFDGTVALAHSGALSSEPALRIRDELAALPPGRPMFHIIDTTERYAILDASIDVVLAGDYTFGGMLGGGAPLAAIPYVPPDVNVVLRDLNAGFDEYVDALRETDYAAITAASDRAESELAAIRNDRRTVVTLVASAAVGDRYSYSRMTGQLLRSLLMPAVSQAYAAETRNTARRRLLHIALTLAAHKAETGEFPPTLDDLADELGPVPPDPFTGRPFRYQRTDDGGYRLYSVGQNMQDDGGQTYDSLPGGDDLTIETP